MKCQQGGFIVYPCSGVRPSSSSTILKDRFLPNRSANQSKILCEASMGRVNEFVYIVQVKVQAGHPANHFENLMVLENKGCHSVEFGLFYGNVNQIKSNFLIAFIRWAFTIGPLIVLYV